MTECGALNDAPKRSKRPIFAHHAEDLRGDGAGRIDHHLFLLLHVVTLPKDAATELARDERRVHGHDAGDHNFLAAHIFGFDASHALESSVALIERHVGLNEGRDTLVCRDVPLARFDDDNRVRSAPIAALRAFLVRFAFKLFFGATDIIPWGRADHAALLGCTRTLVPT